MAKELLCIYSLLFVAGIQEHYAPDRVQCDYPDRVDCEDRPICDENDENCIEPASTVSTITPPTGNPDFDCPSPSGYFADPKNCIKYYHCFEGNVEEHITCPNGKLRFCTFYNLVYIIFKFKHRTKFLFHFEFNYCSKWKTRMFR